MPHAQPFSILGHLVLWLVIITSTGACSAPVGEELQLWDETDKTQSMIAQTKKQYSQKLMSAQRYSEAAFPSIGILHFQKQGRQGVCSASAIDHYASLKPQKGHFFALTAGHCVVEEEAYSISKASAIASTKYRFEWRRPWAFWLKPENRSLFYQGQKLYAAYVIKDYHLLYDLALIEMAPEYENSNPLLPIMLPLYSDAFSMTAVPLKERLTVLGYGLNQYPLDDPPPPQRGFGFLRAGYMEFLEQQGFLAYMGAYDDEGTTICFGDSGGPVVISQDASEQQIVGVISNFYDGRACAYHDLHTISTIVTLAHPDLLSHLKAFP